MCTHAVITGADGCKDTLEAPASRVSCRTLLLSIEKMLRCVCLGERSESTRARPALVHSLSSNDSSCDCPWCTGVPRAYLKPK